MNAQSQTKELSPHPKHLRDRLRQIWLPIGAGSVIVLGVMVFVVVKAAGPDNAVSEAADVSVVFLCLPSLVFGLVLLALAGGLAFLVTKAIGKTPYVMFRIRGVVMKISQVLMGGADRVVSPILAVESKRAGFRRLKDLLFPPSSR